MKAKAILECLVIFLILLSVSGVVAAGPPLAPPCIFYGYVTVAGQPAPDGINITAFISGTSLSWTNMTRNGTYGWPAKGSDTIEISSANASAPQKDGGATGDKIVFYVGGTQNVQTAYFESGGAKRFDLSVAKILEQPGSRANSSLTMSLGCPTLYSGYTVKINGTLNLANGTGIPNANLTLAYIPVNGNPWTNIASINTSTHGSYYTEWVPPTVTGYYLLEVSWEGNEAIAGSEASACLGATTPDGKYVFSVVSNSVVSNLAYNSTTRLLNFTAVGSSATIGYANVTFAKNLIGEITGVRAYMNEDMTYVTVTSTDTSWTLHLVFPQSTHDVGVSLGPPEQPILAASCSSSTSYVGFKVEINGDLTLNGTGLSGAPIFLSYSVTGGSSWNDLTLVYAGSDGGFSAVWAPSVTGNYLIKATWNGNATYTGVSTVISLAVTVSSNSVPPFAQENVFSVASNSTVSELTFNSTSQELIFTVSGTPGTTGYADVFLAKSVVHSLTGVKVFVDQNEVNYNVTPMDDSWWLHFTYQHSTHEVVVNLASTSVDEFPNGLAIMGMILIAAMVSAVVGRRKLHVRS